MQKVRKLKNGMRVHLVPFTGTDAATVLVLTKVGSRYEDDKVWGGSHFIEHLMFKGTKRRPNTIDISKTIERYGALYNAYTGKDLTGYYVKIDGDKSDVAIDLLHDMIFHSKFDAREMNRERGVIIEEIKMYEENPIMHIGDLIEEAMFDGSTLGREIAGTPETMRTMKRSDLIAYRDRYYVPSEMVVVVAGAIKPGTWSLLQKTFGSVKTKDQPESFVPFGDLPERKRPRVARQYKDLQQIQVALAFPTVGSLHEDVPALMILGRILGGGMSSRLFIEVREKRGLCYSIRSWAEAYEDIGKLIITSGLDAQRLDVAMKTIWSELKKIRRDGVTAQELRFMKDHIAGLMKLANENSYQRAEFYGKQELLKGSVETPEQRLKKIRAVTRADVKRVAQEAINFKKLSIAAIGPYKTDAALLKHFPVIR